VRAFDGYKGNSIDDPKQKFDVPGRNINGARLFIPD